MKINFHFYLKIWFTPTIALNYEEKELAVIFFCFAIVFHAKNQ